MQVLLENRQILLIVGSIGEFDVQQEMARLRTKTNIEPDPIVSPTAL
jgi:hypothetical protein